MTGEVSDGLITPAFKVTAVTAAQVLVFVILYEAMIEIYVSNVGSINKVFGFGMQMDYGLYLLSILAGLQAVVHILSESFEQKMITTLVCVAIWIAYWGNVAEVVPRRFVMLSLLGMFSFFIGILLAARRRDQGLI